MGMSTKSFSMKGLACKTFSNSLNGYEYISNKQFPHFKQPYSGTRCSQFFLESFIVKDLNNTNCQILEILKIILGNNVIQSLFFYPHDHN